MNLVLLDNDDFLQEDRVQVRGRRLEHVRQVHRAKVGDELRVGRIGGRIGRGRMARIDADVLEMTVLLDAAPPAPLPLRLILALPRPKVLNRTIAAAVSMGIHDIDLINAWRVEKAYWGSPKVSGENLKAQAILGLEQSGDTRLPEIRLHRTFMAFVREELPGCVAGRQALLADPGAEKECPRGLSVPVTLAVGPEGGFIDRELATFCDAGFTAVTFGPRVLRVETALAYLVGRLF